MADKSLIPPIHRQRYIKHKVLGLSIEDIAKQDKCSPRTIENSIDVFETFKSVYSVEQVVLGQSAVILKNLELQQEALAGALQARRTVIVNRQGSEVMEESGVPDHETRLHAAEVMNSMVEAIMPKGGGISISQNVSNQVSTPSITMSFEDRLRQIKEKRDGLMLEAKTVDVEPDDPIPVG